MLVALVVGVPPGQFVAIVAVTQLVESLSHANVRLSFGSALDRVLVNAVSDNFDDQMEYVLTAMIASAEIGPDGEVRLNRPPVNALSPELIAALRDAGIV